ncbi:tRNA lysidine(34) synthetase TilS [Acidihalobacter yilgarnensis]|uniref:tRNA lysidine(34) synthetase TilS n=1 Tax=Acidihalobacter yilgarnensis TaxID=2819280 RepID=UPI000B0E3360|nr:tRNA lysidine(34) synthetase TilS [Acidihalobacter yilgarnensis]
MHVHHGLQADADAWADTCAAHCAEWGIEFELLRIAASPRSGDSPEARARELRYAALRSVMARGDGLLTAHHADDQAETLLLQLLRGAGPAGLAAMPRLAPFGCGWHARPLLALRRTALRDYLTRAGIGWIEDPTNSDLSPARNYLRHRILPLIEARWPATVTTLGRAAGLQAESQGLLSHLGRRDLETASGEWPGVLSVSALRVLPDARLHNAVRVWLSDKGLPLPNARRLSDLRRVLEARRDGRAQLCWPGAELRRYRDELYADIPLSSHDSTRVFQWDPATPLDLPGLGLVLRKEDLRCDLSSLMSAGAHLTIRFRRGGERCKMSPRGRSRALKSLLQEAGVPPWLRDRIPLLYADEHLVEVIGYWRCHEDHQAEDGLRPP